MKIGILAHGKSVWMQHWANLLTQNGYEVHYFSFDSPTQSFPFHYHTFANTYLHGFTQFILIGKFLNEIQKKYNFNLFHAFYATNYGLTACLQKKVPVVVTFAGSDILIEPQRNHLFKWVDKFVAKRANAINAVSNQIKEKLIYNYKVSESKIRVFSEGVDLNLFSLLEKKHDESKIRIISTRNFYEIYDQETVFQAAVQILKQEENVEFYFFGDGPLKAKYIQIVKNKKLTKRVYFLGWQPREKIAHKLAESQIYISASRSDGTSTSLLEAMASGCFPVVSAIAANSNWIKHGENGFLFEIGSTEKLRELLLKAIANQEIRKKSMKINRELVSRYADENQVITKLENLYSLALSNWKS